MKYSISNIAWATHEKEDVYALLNKYEFSGLEIAPSLFLDGNSDPYNNVSIDERQKSKLLLDSFNLELVSMQSILFGSSGLFLFNDQNSRELLLNYCKKAVDFASSLNIGNIVFGSPKNRIIPENMDSNDAQSIAINFFSNLASYADDKNTIIAMEANASAYGGNFVTQTKDALTLIKQVNSQSFKLTLDMGTMSLENEGLDVIEEAMPYVNHIHICEGFLSPIYEGNDNIHRQRAKIIKSLKYNKYLSIEMKSISTENNLEHIEKALQFVNYNYR